MNLHRCLKLSLITFFLFIQSSLLAESGVKLQRVFIDKDKKIIEQVLISATIARVESSGYSYVIDTVNEELLFKSSKGKIHKISFLDLKEQGLKLRNRLNINEHDNKIRVKNQLYIHKGLKTKKITVIPPNKKYIIVRVLQTSEKEKLISTFFQTLYNKLGYIPIFLNSTGLDITSPFNDLFILLEVIFNSKDQGNVQVPVFALRPATVTQIEFSNIVKYSLDDEALYYGFKKTKTGIIPNIFIFIKYLWESLASLFKNSEPPFVVHLQAKDVKWDKFWTDANCIFYKNASSDLFVFFDKKNKYQLSQAASFQLKDAYETILDFLKSTQGRSGGKTEIEGKISKIIQQALYFEHFDLSKAAKIKFNKGLARANELCYLKKQVNKVYEELLKH